MAGESLNNQAGRVAELAKQGDALFTFLTVEGFDATNFRGEQAVRHCVVNRKTWGGNRTWPGAATQLSSPASFATAAKHGIEAVAYLAAAPAALTRASRSFSADPYTTIAITQPGPRRPTLTSEPQ